MPLMTGDLTDAGIRPMEDRRVRLLWILNRTTVHGDAVVVNAPVEARITGSSFAVTVEQTYEGEFYLLKVEWRDANDQLKEWRWLDLRVEVTAEGGTIGGVAGVPMRPDSVATSMEPPSNQVPYWLEAVKGAPDPDTDTGPGVLYAWRP